MKNQHIEYTSLPHLINRILPSENIAPLSIEERLAIFKKGKTSALDTPELFEMIARHISDLHHRGDNKNSAILLENLGEGTLSQSQEIREKSLIPLILLSKRALAENQEELILFLTHLLISWLKEENQLISGYEFVCLQLGDLLERLIDLGLWHHVSNFIIPIKKIVIGQLYKEKIQQQIIFRLYSRIAQPEHLKKLTTCYLNNTAKRQPAKQMLTTLGNRSTPFLLQTLAESACKEERFRLLKLIPSQGVEALPPMITRLHSNPPWYLARNIIHMMSYFPDDTIFPHVKPYLNHSDIRVQKEALKCLTQVSSSHRASILMEASKICSDELKANILQAMKSIDDPQLAETLLFHLRNIDTYTASTRDAIVKETCKQLTRFSSHAAYDVIARLYRMQQAAPNLDEDTISTLKITLYLLKKYAPPQVSTSQHAKLKAISNSVPKNDTSQRNIHFRKTQPGSGDIPAPKKHHLDLHKQFYSVLSKKDADHFSTLLRTGSYRKDEILVSQGDIDTRLFFIEKGAVALRFAENEPNWTRCLYQGDIFGFNIFMSHPEWPVTLQATAPTDVLFFDQEQLLLCQQRYPQLCHSFITYCQGKDTLLTIANHLTNIDSSKKCRIIPLAGEAGETISDIRLENLSAYSINISLRLPPGIDYTVFSEKRFKIKLMSPKTPDGEEISGFTVAMRFLESQERTLYLAIGFEQMINPVDLLCEAISLSHQDKRK